MPRAKRLTLTRIVIHDFNRALRVWAKVVKPADIFRQLTQERTRILALGVRNFFFSAVGVLWLGTNQSVLSLKLSVIEISIPVVYVIFAVATLLFTTLVNLLNYFFLNEFVRVATSKLFKFDGQGLTVFHDGSGIWAAPLVVQYRFLSSGTLHRRLGWAAMWLFNLPFLLGLAVAYWTVFAVGWAVVVSEGVSVASTFTVVGWLMMLSPLAMVVLLILPFKFSKNTSYIRWQFLFALHRRFGGRPPRIRSWLTPPKMA